MEWLQNLLDGENGNAVQLVLITLFIAVLLIAIIWLFRKLSGASAPKAAKNRVPRLSVTDSSRIDESRFLVLVRRDNVEHLVMIGGPSDLVIESNIQRFADTTAQKPSQKSVNMAQATLPAENPAALNQPETATIAPSVTASAAGATALAAGSAAIASTSDVTMTEIETASESLKVTIPEEQPTVLAETVEDVPAPATSSEIEDLSANINFDAMQEELAESVTIDLQTAEATPAPVESNFEASISAQLDEALTGEIGSLTSDDQTSDTQTAPTPEVEAADNATSATSSNETASSNEPIDDMQRLLDELAGSKEPA